jgi:protein-tyrosine phosphatase
VSNILVVCTANQCRSPLAAAMLRRSVAARGLEHTVLSGGIIEGGEPSPEMLVEVGLLHDIDLRAHRSRQLTPELLAGADLVLCMTRLHVRDVSVMNPVAWPVTFTMLEFIRRSEELGAGLAALPLADRVAMAHGDRTPGGLLAAGRGEDIPDPMGKGFDAFVTLGETLATEVEAVADLL